MPWRVTDKAPGCSGYAVVKEGTSEVVGCHKTKAEAINHMQALYASEADKIDSSQATNKNPQQGTPSGMPSTGKKKKLPMAKADTYSPTSGMKSAAKRALAWKDEGKRGGTIIGITRAHQIVSGENLSASTVKRMYSFFSRHEVDKRATGFSAGEEGYPSPGRVAWDLWGGDAGFSWSRGLVARMQKGLAGFEGEGSLSDQMPDDKEHEDLTLDDDYAGLNERQSDQAEAYYDIVEEYGQFDQGSGPDGAHYAPGSDNPFKSDGLMCSSCIFFEDGACEIVSGDIDPEGVCKLWIIPENGGDDMEQEQENEVEVEKRDYSTQQRNRMAHEGQAMPDGSFPIANEQDLRNAIRSIGRASNPEAAKKHIIRRARALGLTELLPEEWKANKSDQSSWGGKFFPN
jgi:hypothetical protein